MSLAKNPGGRPKSDALITARIVAARGGKLQVMLTFRDGQKNRHKRIATKYPANSSEDFLEDKKAFWLAKYTAAGVTGATVEAAVRSPGSGGGDDWWTTYLNWRESEGLTSVKVMYEAHIKPALGAIHPRDWTKADCERLRNTLDAKIKAGHWKSDRRQCRFGWKRAWNVWALFTSACKQASASKNEALRVRDDNPCLGVLPPNRGKKKQKQWLYPTECAQLLACEDVPLRWRILCAVLTYAYVRPSELRALQRRDVELDTGLINITKAWSFEDDEQGDDTKTEAGVRYVPIEAELMPLMRLLCEGLAADDYLFPSLPPHEDWADTFRTHLRRAKVDREKLFEDTATVKNITMYDLRATGITWRTLRGDDTRVIQAAAGHEKYATTEGYVRAAAIFKGRVGDPFPPLPEVLRSRSLITHLEKFRSARNVGRKVASPRGFEPLLQP